MSVRKDKTMMRFWGAMLLVFLIFNVSAVTLASDPAAGMRGKGSGLFTVQQDPKYPGKPLWKMWAQQIAGGGIGLQGKGFQVTLVGVKAYLFQKGIFTAVLTAPKVTGNTLQNIVVATGGVKVVSQTQLGTSLQADMLTWYAAKNDEGQIVTGQIVATGHVIYRRGGLAPMFIKVPVLYADTALKKVWSNGAGQGGFPKGL